MDIVSRQGDVLLLGLRSIRKYILHRYSVSVCDRTVRRWLERYAEDKIGRFGRYIMVETKTIDRIIAQQCPLLCYNDEKTEEPAGRAIRG